MIAPADWREYEWRVTDGAGAGVFQQDGFVWRIQGYSTAGGTITFTYVDTTTSVITLVAGEQFALEPAAMRAGIFLITFSAGVTHWIVEWLRRVQA